MHYRNGREAKNGDTVVQSAGMDLVRPCRHLECCIMQSRATPTATGTWLRSRIRLRQLACVTVFMSKTWLRFSRNMVWTNALKVCNSS